jgi:phosphate transport system substrate-binding protein
MKFVNYIIFIAILCIPLMVNAAPVRLSGSTSLEPYISSLITANPQSFTESDFTLHPVGSGKGLAELLRGRADIAMLSASSSVMKARMPHIAWSELHVHDLPPTQLSFVVHKDNNVRALSVQEITKILKKEITNWAELGGRDQRIYIITEHRSGGIRATVEEQLLDGMTIKEPIRKLSSGANIVNYTARFENALGIVSDIMVDDTVQRVTLDRKLIQPQYFVTKKPTSPEILHLIELFQKLDMSKRVID